MKMFPFFHLIISIYGCQHNTNCMNEFIEVSSELSNRGNPKSVKKICEWTGDEFWVEWKYRNARFKDTLAVSEWKKSQSREIVKCKNCGSNFERYKNITHPRSGEVQQYCSNYCNLTSKEKKQKLKNWGNSDKNHWRNKEVQAKVKITKFERYGDENYNNMDKSIETMMTNHGVPCPFYLKQCQSNGITISKGQRKLFEITKNKYNDAILEHYLEDINKSVDIFIPSKNIIIEYFGDYWHCNPIKYNKDYYHTQIHKTAEEIWKLDNDRVNKFKQKGYGVYIVWESEFKCENYKLDIM